MEIKIKINILQLNKSLSVLSFIDPKAGFP